MSVAALRCVSRLLCNCSSMVRDVGLSHCCARQISVPIEGLFAVVFVAPKIVARLGEPLVTMGVFLRSDSSETVDYKSSRSLFPVSSSATAGHKVSLTVTFPTACKLPTLLTIVNILGGQMFVLKVGLLVSHTES
jgi:hypothetical protein